MDYKKEQAIYKHKKSGNVYEFIKADNERVILHSPKSDITFSRSKEDFKKYYELQRIAKSKRKTK